MSSAMAETEGSGAMFDKIAARYDLLNQLMSFGLDRGWRRKLVRAVGSRPQGHVLDVATGTADVALALCRAYPQMTLVGLDSSPKMLEVGRHKVEAEGLSQRIDLVAGDAQDLAFGDQSFDAVTIAFGIRNVPDRARALAEMARVTKPGGSVVILELSEPRGTPLAPLARFHVHTIVPWLGALLSGHKEYRYLQRSIAAFPAAAVFVELMGSAGFAPVTYERLSFGAAHLFVGRVAAP